MIIKVCDRCKKQYHPPLPFMQAKLPIYKITKVEAFSGIREIDLCVDCQDDFKNNFDKWLNETENKNNLGE